MEIVLFLWLAGVSETLKLMLGLLGFMSIVGLIMWITYPYTDRNTTQIRTVKRGLICAGLAIILAVLLPNKNTLYLMAGGYYGQKALQSETAGKVMTIINGHLDEKIKELTK